jgi:predicted protein tyrosine phosphatase
VISLLDPETPFPDAGPAYAQRHLRVHVHDITHESDGWITPSANHVETLLDFIRGWDRADPILIHCYAGISRSTATAFITACVHNPEASERVIAQALREASPSATPNMRIVALADEALGRKGRMLRAIEAIGRGSTWIEIGEAEPFSLPSVYGPSR